MTEFKVSILDDDKRPIFVVTVTARTYAEAFRKAAILLPEYAFNDMEAWDIND